MALALGRHARRGLAPWRWPLLVAFVAALAVGPVALLASSVLDPNIEVWRQQWSTRLPSQLLSTVVLLAGVGAGSLVLGTALAWLLSAYRFPGSRLLGWLLMLPLAMPAYILGFVTLSVFGYTGPLQSAWRSVAGPTAWFPPVESIGGAIVVFTLVLYPYVYLLGRAALRDQAGWAFDMARSLGASPTQAARRAVLPLLRPALFGGLAVAMMETLTDFATVQYFGVETVSVAVFRVWKGAFDRDAASELATLVLAFALLVITLERVLRGRARFGQAGGAASGMAPAVLTGARGWLATGACALVFALAFGAPATQLAVWALAQSSGDGVALLERMGGYLANSVVLAAIVAGVCVVTAVLVTNAVRFVPTPFTRVAARLSTVGYALPGPVVAIGTLLALVGVDRVLRRVGLTLPGAVVTGSFLGLVYAYGVRFLAPALNSAEAGLGQVPEEVTASARTLGRGPGLTLMRVHLPLARTSILTGALLVAVDALRELPIVLLLRPFGFDTLAVWVWNLASESRWEQAALPSLTILAAALVPVVVLSRQLSRPVRQL